MKEKAKLRLSDIRVASFLTRSGAHRAGDGPIIIPSLPRDPCTNLDYNCPSQMICPP